MANGHLKFIIIGLVFLLSLVFFWQTTQRFLFPSRAAATPVKIFFEKDSVASSVGGEVPINVFLLSGATAPISGATLVFDYDPAQLQYVDKGETFVDAVCKANKYTLTTRANVINDTSRGRLIVSRLTTEKNLPAGLTCWGTVVFSPVGESTKLSLSSDLSQYEIVGPGNTFTPTITDGSAVKITTVGSGTEPTPFITPIIGRISIFPKPPTCARKSEGDANCDGRVDMIDFELWRREFLNRSLQADCPRLGTPEGLLRPCQLTARADFDGNGRVDLLDFNSWRITFFNEIKG